MKKILHSVMLGLMTLLTIPSIAMADELNSGDTAWLMVSTVLVLFMTLPGLALFYGGLVRQKNVISVLKQCLGIAAMVTILWVVIGYSLAFDTTGMEAGVVGLNAFVGGLGNLFMNKVTVDSMSGTIPESVFAMFQLTFAIITPGLIIGAFAERMKFSAMMVFTALWMLIVYCPLTHMVWGGEGSFLGDKGLLDFAGGTVVHISAGIAALVAAIILGPRVGWGKDPMQPHNITMVFRGTCFLWVGWFGFNAGSQLAADGGAGMALAVTQISPAVAAFVWMMIDIFRGGKPNLVGACTGAIAGLAAITPASGFVGPMGALAIGTTSSVICYYFAMHLKHALKYDDSLDAFGVHGVGGAIGTVMTAVFAPVAMGGSVDSTFGQLIGPQVFGTVFTFVYSGVLSFIIFKLIDATIGLRVSEEEEKAGLDDALHGEKGYEF